jgi:uncharacterized membrane protein
MDEDHQEQRESRTTLLILGMAVLFALPCFGFLVVLTDGFVLAVLAVLVILGAVAGAHYLLWGRSMARNTAGEREEEEMRERIEGNEWDVPPR